MTGRLIIDEKIKAYAREVASAAPLLDDDQRAQLRRLLAGVLPAVDLAARSRGERHVADEDGAA
jgi:hypothetical protein